MKTFVIGDIHGAYKALKQCLEKSNFNYNNDRLICLGDVADFFPDTVECFEELLKIKNLIYIRGNHDQWLLDWFEKGIRPEEWLSQGGEATIKSYAKYSISIKEKHFEFLKKSLFYFIDDNRIFTHGGFNPNIPIEENKKEYFMWDRTFFDERGMYPIAGYKEIFVGHTIIWDISQIPTHFDNVWYLDTGAGRYGKLSIMNIDTKEFWQSNIVRDIY